MLTYAKQLNEVADIITGITEDRESFDGIEYLCILPNSFNQFGDVNPLPKITRKDPAKTEQLVCIGDVLIKRLNPNFPYLVREIATQTVISTNLFIVRPKRIIYPAYLAFLFEQPGVMAQIEHLSGASVAIKAISAKKLMELVVPMIPVDKQKLLGDLWLLNKCRKKLLNSYLSECDLLLSALADKLIG